MDPSANLQHEWVAQHMHTQSHRSGAWQPGLPSVGMPLMGPLMRHWFCTMMACSGHLSEPFYASNCAVSETVGLMWHAAPDPPRGVGDRVRRLRASDSKRPNTRQGLAAACVHRQPQAARVSEVCTCSFPQGEHAGRPSQASRGEQAGRKKPRRASPPPPLPMPLVLPTHAIDRSTAHRWPQARSSLHITSSSHPGVA